MNLVILYIPVPDEETGRRLAREAVKNSLAACANLLGAVESVYEWQGALCQEQERILLLKTTEGKAEEAMRQMEALHPYDCPCVLRLGADANAAFADWVKETLM